MKCFKAALMMLALAWPAAARAELPGTLSFNAGPVDLFVSYSKYVWGHDAHNGQVFGAGVSWYFGLPQ